MNSLSACSRTVLTKNPSQLSHPARAARIDIVHRDPQSLGDLICFQLVDVGQLEDLPVVVVLDLPDAPGDEVLGAVLVEFIGDLFASVLAPRRLPAGERGVV